MLTWRAAGPADEAGLAALFDTVERTAPVWVPAVPLDDTDAVLAVDGDGRPLAYAGVADMGPAGGALRVRLTSVVHPDADADATRQAFDWLVARAYLLRDERHPGVPVTLDARCAASDKDRYALLTDSGFRLVDWQLDQVRALDAPVELTPVPDGVRIAVYDDRYAEPAMAAHNAAYAGSPYPMEPDLRAWRTLTIDDPWYLAPASFVALAGADQVVGILISRHNPDTGEAIVVNVATAPPWRGRGVGAALVSRALDRYREAGLGPARLRVRDDNPAALRLYRRMGFIDSGRGFAAFIRPPD